MVLTAVTFADNARRLDRRLGSLQAEQEAVREQIDQLRASYAHLTAPDVLRPLAERFLRLEPITGSHMVAFENLPMRPVPTPPQAPVGELPPFTHSPFTPRGESGPTRDPVEARTPSWLLSPGGSDLQPATFGYTER